METSTKKELELYLIALGDLKAKLRESIIIAEQAELSLQILMKKFND